MNGKEIDKRWLHHVIRERASFKLMLRSVWNPPPKSNRRSTCLLELD
jgi:hypothetical protein